MEDNKNIVNETEKPDSPKPGTKPYLEAELAKANEERKALEAELAELKAKAEMPITGTEATVAEPPKEKMYTVKLPKIKAGQEDVPVWVNERSWIIKRGVEVEVPECVYEVLKHQEEMMETIMQFEAANKK